jgi:hypothetical protein
MALPCWQMADGSVSLLSAQGALKKRKKEKRRVATYLPTFFWRFSGLILESIFMAFLGLSRRVQRNGQKRDKTNEGKK